MFIRNLSSKLRKSSGGFSLLEVMIASTLFAIAMAITMTVFIYCSKSFAYLANFAALDQANRVALDKMTKELRAAQTVTTNTSSSLSFINYSGTPVTYAFNGNSRELVRTENGGIPTVLLTNCDLLNFSVGMRVVTNLTFDNYPAAYGTNIKEVNLRWQADCTIPGTQNVVSEDMQSAKVVIRAACTDGQ